MTLQTRPTPTTRRRVAARLNATTALVSAALALLPGLAHGQAFNGFPVVAEGNVGIVNSPNSTTFTMNTSTAVINWFDVNPDFLPAGNTANFIGGVNAPGNYRVINRVLTDPIGAGFPVVTMAGTVNSTILQTPGSPQVRGGQVWFYTPGGFLISSTARFNIGSLLLTTGDISFNPAGRTELRTTPDSVVGITIQPGAEINATAEGSYVVLNAPLLNQGGLISVNGSATLIAAESVDLRLNAGLFDITVNAGSFIPAGQNQITHSGTTGGPTGTGPTDNHRVTLMAVPKSSDVLISLLGGTLGYGTSLVAGVEGGAVVIAAGGTVARTTGTVSRDGPAIWDGTAQVSGTTFTSDTTIYGSQAVVIQDAAGSPTFQQDMTLISPRLVSMLMSGTQTTPTSVGGRALIDVGDADVATSELPPGDVPGTPEAIIIAQNGGRLTVAGDLIINGDRDVGTGQIGASLNGLGSDVTVRANGGTITVGGALGIDVRGLGQPALVGGAGGSGFGGTVEITTAPTTAPGQLSVTGATTINASGVGAGGPGGAGSGQGGRIDVLFDTNSLVTLGSGLTAIANGGGAATTGDAFGGSGTGGQITITNRFSTVSITGALSVSATGSGGASGTSESGEGGPGIGIAGPDGAGGQVEFLVEGGALTLGSLTLNVAGTGGTGGASGGSSGESGTGGNGAGGVIDLRARSGGTFTVNGAATLISTALGGAPGTGPGGGGGGGQADGGTITVRTEGGGTAMSLRTLTINAPSTAAAGRNGTGSNGLGGRGGDANGATINVEARGSSTLTVTNAVTVTASTTSGAGATGVTGGNGGDASGGTINVLAEEGGIVTLSNTSINANTTGGPGGPGIGGIGGIGGIAQGGNIRFETQTLTTFGAGPQQQILLRGLTAITADALGGAGGAPGNPADGSGGDGIGGSLSFSASAGGTISVVDLPAGALNDPPATPGELRATIRGVGGAGGANTIETAGAGGDGLGGTFDAFVFGGSLQLLAANVTSEGIGGAGGTGSTGGEGGTGTGGAIFVSSDGSGLIRIDSGTVITRGRGGAGGAGISGVGGTGGNGSGGEIGIGVGIDTGGFAPPSRLELGTVTIASEGEGGIGGSTPVESSSTGGNGGQGEGGLIDWTIAQGGSVQIDTQLTLRSRGTGGSNGAGNNFSTAGEGRGGVIITTLGGGRLTGELLTVLSSGVGAAATAPRDSQGNEGARGEGGFVAVAANPGSTVNLTTINLRSEGLGGAGSAGGTGTDPGDGNGGAGGEGQGGAVRLASNSQGGGLTTTQVVVGQASLTSIGIGGAGGNGRAGAVNNAGGVGGTGNGGSADVVLGADSFNQFANLLVSSEGAGGAGGVSGGLGDGGAGGTGNGGAPQVRVLADARLLGGTVTISAAGIGGRGGDAGPAIGRARGSGGLGGTGSGGGFDRSAGDLSSGAAVGMFAIDREAEAELQSLNLAAGGEGGEGGESTVFFERPGPNPGDPPIQEQFNFTACCSESRGGATVLAIGDATSTTLAAPLQVARVSFGFSGDEGAGQSATGGLAELRLTNARLELIELRMEDNSTFSPAASGIYLDNSRLILTDFGGVEVRTGGSFTVETANDSFIDVPGLFNITARGTLTLTQVGALPAEGVSVRAGNFILTGGDELTSNATFILAGESAGTDFGNSSLFSFNNITMDGPVRSSGGLDIRAGGTLFAADLSASGATLEGGNVRVLRAVFGGETKIISAPFGFGSGTIEIDDLRIGGNTAILAGGDVFLPLVRGSTDDPLDGGILYIGNPSQNLPCCPQPSADSLVATPPLASGGNITLGTIETGGLDVFAGGELELQQTIRVGGRLRIQGNDTLVVREALFSRDGDVTLLARGPVDVLQDIDSGGAITIRSATDEISFGDLTATGDVVIVAAGSIGNEGTITARNIGLFAGERTSVDRLNARQPAGLVFIGNASMVPEGTTPDFTALGSVAPDPTNGFIFIRNSLIAGSLRAATTNTFTSNGPITLPGNLFLRTGQALALSGGAVQVGGDATLRSSATVSATGLAVGGTLTAIADGGNVAVNNSTAGNNMVLVARGGGSVLSTTSLRAVNNIGLFSSGGISVSTVATGPTSGAVSPVGTGGLVVMGNASLAGPNGEVNFTALGSGALAAAPLAITANRVSAGAFRAATDQGFTSGAGITVPGNLFLRTGTTISLTSTGGAGSLIGSNTELFAPGTITLTGFSTGGTLLATNEGALPTSITTTGLVLDTVTSGGDMILRSRSVAGGPAARITGVDLAAGRDLIASVDGGTLEIGDSSAIRDIVLRNATGTVRSNDPLQAGRNLGLFGTSVIADTLLAGPSGALVIGAPSLAPDVTAVPFATLVANPSIDGVPGAVAFNSITAARVNVVGSTITASGPVLAASDVLMDATSGGLTLGAVTSLTGSVRLLANGDLVAGALSAGNFVRATSTTGRVELQNASAGTSVPIGGGMSPLQAGVTSGNSIGIDAATSVTIGNASASQDIVIVAGSGALSAGVLRAGRHIVTVGNQAITLGGAITGPVDQPIDPVGRGGFVHIGGATPARTLLGPTLDATQLGGVAPTPTAGAITVGRVSTSTFRAATSSTFTSTQAVTSAGLFSVIAGGNATFNARSFGTEMLIDSSDITLGASGGLGDGSRTTSLILRPRGASAVQVGGSASTGYVLDQAEVGRLQGQTIQIDVVVTGTGPAATAPLLTLSAFTLQGSAGTTPNLAGPAGTLFLTTPGDVAVTGAAQFTGMADGNRFLIRAGGRIDVNTTAGGRITLSGAGPNGLGGTLGMEARDILVATAGVIDTFRVGVPTDRAAQLLANNGPVIAEGVIQANTMSFSPGRSLYIQNTGTAQQNAGFTSGSGGITLNSAAGRLVDVDIYGRTTSPTGGFVVNFDTRDEVRRNPFELTAGGFSANSAINNCLLSAVTCDNRPPELDRIGAQPDLLGGIDPDSTRAIGGPALFNPALFIFNDLDDLDSLLADDPLNQPVTSGGNESLWEDLLTSGEQP
jgi:hypothetical protein